MKRRTVLSVIKWTHASFCCSIRGTKVRYQHQIHASNIPYIYSFVDLFIELSAEDPVYLRSTEARDEYVGNENGIIWRGTWKSPRPTTWNYSQVKMLSYRNFL